MPQILVNADACVGAGQCALTAPDVFDQDDDGIVVLIDDAVTEQARAAVGLCPARAIAIGE